MTGSWWAHLGGLAAVALVTLLAARWYWRAAIREAREQAYWDGAEALARAAADRQERLWEDMGYPPAVTAASGPGGRHAAPPPPSHRQEAEPVTSEWAAGLIADVESWNRRHQLHGDAA